MGNSQSGCIKWGTRNVSNGLSVQFTTEEKYASPSLAFLALLFFAPFPPSLPPPSSFSLF